MQSCRTIQENLTAWIDGELSARWNDRVGQHVQACSACAAETESLRAAIEWQRRTLVNAIVVEGLDPAVLQRRFERALRADDEATVERGWSWLWRPVAFASAAVAVAAGVLLFVAGGPQAILMPLGLEAPPAAVGLAPDLFRDYPLIQRLDFLEHFDTVESVPLDDEQGSENG